MTKMKSKKMTKSTFAIIIMGIAMVAMLAFGGTFAYFTANAKEQQLTFTTAKLQVSVTDASITTLQASVTNNVVPGQAIIGTLNAKGDGAASYKELSIDPTGSTADYWLFVKFTAVAVSNGDVIKISETQKNIIDTYAEAAEYESGDVTANTWYQMKSTPEICFIKVTENLATVKTFKFAAAFSKDVQADNSQKDTDADFEETNNVNVDDIMGVELKLNFEVGSIQVLNQATPGDAYAALTTDRFASEP